MTSDEELLEQVNLGKEADKFLGTRLGKSVIDEADKDAAEAAKQMANVSPTDHGLLMKHQVDFKAAQKVAGYFMRFINEGETAVALYNQRQYKE